MWANGTAGTTGHYTIVKLGKVYHSMEFFKSLVPAVISGEGPSDHGAALPKETGPRLLRIKRLGLLAMGHTIDEDQVHPVVEEDPRVGFSKPARSNRTGFKGTSDSHVQSCSSYL